MSVCLSVCMYVLYVCVCVYCGDFTTDRAMVYTQGGLPSIQHNEMCDLLGELLMEACHGVAIEPPLVPVTIERFRARGTTVIDDARADIRALGFWTKGEDALFDIKIFHPQANCYRSKPLISVYTQQERLKKLRYEERIINIQHGLFTPLVFSTTG